MNNPISKHFHFEIKNGCVIYNDGTDIMLLDTGSPRTFGIANDPLNVFPKIHEFVDPSVTTLRGMNGMAHRRVLVDYLNGEIFLNDAPELENPIARYDIDLVFYLPTIQISIDGQIHNMLLDTGARTSYLFTPYVNTGKPVGKTKDFYIGEPDAFEVELFEHSVEVGGQSFNVNLAPPIASIARALNCLNVDGIIGYELFRNFKVLFDFQNRRFVVGK